MFRHLVRLSGLAALMVAAVFYPYLPGRYDSLAVGLSTAVQLLAAAGMLLLPLAALWLAHAALQRGRPAGRGGYFLALATLAAGSVLALAVALLVLAGIGYTLGVLALSVWFWAVSRLMPGLRRLKAAGEAGFNPAPVYLALIPLAVVAAQVVLARPALEYSRRRAIAQSAELIQAIEAYRAARGRFPDSLLAVWPDYSPGVVGIAQYHYAPSGAAYNLAFEQPRLVFDELGVREFVVYNPLNAHLVPSHASWILLLPPQELAEQQGWFAVNEAGAPHWRYFWFD